MELSEWLEVSLSGTCVQRSELPSESDLVAIHAQLARGAREQRRFQVLEMKDEPGDSDHSE